MLSRSLLAAALLMMGTASTFTPAADDSFAAFSKYAADTFGVKHEPLTTQIPGDRLAFLADGGWTYVSEDSATVAVETNLPAAVKVEYGVGGKFDQSAESCSTAGYIHVVSLVGLKPGTTVSYRVTAVDENGNKVQQPAKTLSPKKVANAVYVTGATPLPLVCNQSGKTYVLKDDLVAAGTGISVTAPGVTIDLNGHTLTYNNTAAPSDAAGSEFGQLATQGTQGVRCSYGTRGSTKLYNGTIKQGAGNGGYGHVPVLFRGDEIAGVFIDYSGSQVSGIVNECKQTHHNVILDRGTELTNRHQGVQCVGVTGDVHHNLIRRARQRGIEATSGAKIDRNEIYVDSCATNSFGIMFYKTKGGEAVGNRIFGTGYLAIGIGTVSEGVSDIRVAKNFIQMQAHAPDTRWAEYGDQSGAYCVRLTWGGANITYENNVLVSKGRDGGMVRGVWFCPGPKISNVVYRNNIIKVISETPDTTAKWGAVVVCGEDSPDTQPGLFENNTIISNFCNVRLGEEYGTGKNARFVGNTFVREGDVASYATVICGFDTFNNNGTVFLNSKFEGGADLSKNRWEGTGDNGFAAGKIDGGRDVIEQTFKPQAAANQ